MSDRRVVITGLGAITPLGNSVDVFWDGLVSGESGVRLVSRHDLSTFPCRIGAECISFAPTEFIDRRDAKRMDRYTQFALAATQEAVSQSGLTFGEEDPTRVGVVIGNGIGGLMELETQHVRLLEKGPEKVSAFTVPRLMANAASGHLSILYNARGMALTIATACASATNAIGEAFWAIRRGQVDVIISGGSEAALTPLGLSAFSAMKAMSTRNDDPAGASRPFDADRDGFVMGEGSGILILEDLERAKRRGAHILAEVLGYGLSADAYHMTQPEESGQGGAVAMAQALQDAGLNPSDIQYINAHGTATTLGDIAETRAIRQVFGSAADSLLVSSTKSMIGHLLGGSGGVELVATVMALTHGVVHPTINLDKPGEGCDLDYVPNTARDVRIKRALSNSFGFGGHNGCVVIGRFE